MKANKPRHNPNKPENKLGEHCPYDDGTRWKECNRPWADHCDGNRYKCYKLFLQHRASLSTEKRDIEAKQDEQYKNGAPRTNCY